MELFWEIVCDRQIRKVKLEISETSFNDEQGRNTPGVL